MSTKQNTRRKLLALLLGLLTIIDIIVLTLALVRFQRSRLMLIGK